MVYLLLFWGLLLQQSYAQSTGNKTKISKVSPASVDSIFSKYDHTNTPGCALAVVHDGHIIYERGYGMSNLEYGIPITPKSPFNVGSITKQFTAMSIVLLAKQGKLSLDDDIRKYVPEVPDYGTKITLRELLHHTSGLRDMLLLTYWAGWRGDDPVTTRDILDIVSRQKGLNFSPGSHYIYCNTGYLLLGEIIKRVSGQSLPDFAAEHIFKPLGMRDTRIIDDHSALIPNRTSAYVTYKTGDYTISLANQDNSGPGGLFTTVEDMARWDEDSYTHKVGGDDGWAMMRQRFVLTDGDTIPYALGLEHGHYRGLSTIGHNGDIAGYHADLTRFPNQHFSVIVLSNDGSSHPGDLALKVADLYLKDDFKKPIPSHKPEVSAQTLSGNEMTRVTGAYQAPLKNYIAIVAGKKDSLVIKVDNQTVPLFPDSDLHFHTPGVKLKFTTKNGKNASGFKVDFKGTGREEVWSRIPFNKPTPEDLAKLAGRYYSEELGTTYAFTVKKDTLVLHRRKFRPEKLTPVNGKTFRFQHWWGHEIFHFKQDGKGKIKGFSLSSYRAMGVQFRRVGPVTKEERSGAFIE